MDGAITSTGPQSPASTVSPDMTHDERVERFTGGLVDDSLAVLPPFEGSDRLRPDGRPRPEFRAELRRIPNAMNVFHVVFTLALPFVFCGVAVAAGSWSTAVAIPVYALVFIAMGTWFQRVLTLHHEAAHRLLFTSKVWNDRIGEKLIGWLVFGDGGDGYRIVHSAHHRDEFGEKEPDFLLYALYPVSKASLRRKLIRDAVGISGYKNLRPAFVGLFKPGRRARAARFLSGQVVVFAIFALLGQPWFYLFFWLLPWGTYFRVFNRLRALAEHGGMTRSADRRLTTHNIHQGFFARYVFLSQGIGYHLAHHVDSGIPMSNLHRLHAALVEDGYVTPEMTKSGYFSFFRTLSR
ncbi:MAG: fatty acid desaturase [Actinomycetota bacterium]